MNNKLRLVINNNFDKREVFFIKKELRSILNLYAQKVSSGDWKDYGLSINKKEVTFDEVKEKFKNEVLLEKGKEAVFDMQDDLEDLLASGNTFEEISETLDVTLIKADKIDRNGGHNNGSKHKY